MVHRWCTSATMEAGHLEVLCGPMFAGKTESLITRVREWRDAGLPVLVVKPAIDDRYSTSEIVSHSGQRVKARTLIPAEAWVVDPVFTHVAVDEAQFLSESDAKYLISLTSTGTHIIVVGLDLNSQGKPFGPMPLFLSYADSVTKLRGKCAACGEPSTRTHCRIDSSAPILVGGAECYEPRCTRCFRSGVGRQADPRA